MRRVLRQSWRWLTHNRPSGSPNARAATARADNGRPSRRAEFHRHGLLLFGAFAGISVCIASLLFYTMGMFVTELGGAFGWDRTSVASGAAFFTAGMAISSPAWGRLADRWPLRPVICLALAATALGFVALATMPGSLVYFFAVVFTMSVIGTGASPVTFTVILNRAFEAARGSALGLALMGTGVGATLGPVLVGAAIARGGWRYGYGALAAVVLIAIPVVWFALRDVARLTPARAGSHTPLEGVAYADAVRMPLFWRLAAIFFIAALGFGGLLVHLVGMLTDAGYPRTEAASIAGLVGLSIIASRLLTGVLCDRVFAPLVGAAAFAASALGCAIITFSIENAVFGAILLGAAIGAEVDLVSYLIARYFGMRGYGAIYGAQYSAFLIGTGVSPIFMGAIFDARGDYRDAQYIALACLTSASLLMLSLPRFDRRARS